MTAFLKALKENPYFLLAGAFFILWLGALTPLTDLLPLRSYAGVSNIRLDESKFSARKWEQTIRNDGEAIEDADLEVIVDDAASVVARIRELKFILKRRLRQPSNSYFVNQELDRNARKARTEPPKIEVFKGGTIALVTTFVQEGSLREPSFVLSGKNLPPTTLSMLKQADYVRLGLGIITVMLFVAALISTAGDMRKP